MAIWPAWMKTGLDWVGGQEEEGVPGLAGMSAPSLDSDAFLVTSK